MFFKKKKEIERLQKLVYLKEAERRTDHTKVREGLKQQLDNCQAELEHHKRLYSRGKAAFMKRIDVLHKNIRALNVTVEQSSKAYLDMVSENNRLRGRLQLYDEMMARAMLNNSPKGAEESNDG